MKPRRVRRNTASQLADMSHSVFLLPLCISIIKTVFGKWLLCENDRLKQIVGATLGLLCGVIFVTIPGQVRELNKSFAGNALKFLLILF